MPTYRALQPVSLLIPNKLKPNGHPHPKAAWHTVFIPSATLLTVPETGYVADLAKDSPILTQDTTAL